MAWSSIVRVHLIRDSFGEKLIPRQLAYLLIAVDAPLTLWFKGRKMLSFALYQFAIVCLLIICL